jgi:hypothetical protein
LNDAAIAIAKKGDQVVEAPRVGKSDRHRNRYIGLTLFSRLRPPAIQVDRKAFAAVNAISAARR